MSSPSLNLKDHFLHPLSSLVLSTASDVRNFVIGGLILQIFFSMEGLLRRRSSYRLMYVFYIIADVFSKYIMALIVATRQQAPNDKGSTILIFWAPFLILHWIGPDNLTAVSSSDNELWSRSAIQLASMVYAIAGSFYHGPLNERLKLPVHLIFFVGLIKYLERILCNYNARLSMLKESLVQQKSKPSTLTLHLEGGEVAPDLMVRDSYHLFESFKGILVDLPVPLEVQERSRHYFLHKNAEVAFKIVTIELKAAYDLLFSKAMLFQYKGAQFFRLVSIICVVLSLVIWCRIKKTGNFYKLDVGITYGLLIAAVIGEINSFWMMLSYYQTAPGILGLRNTNMESFGYKDTPQQLNFFFDIYHGHRRGTKLYRFRTILRAIDLAGGALGRYVKPSMFKELGCLMYEKLKSKDVKETGDTVHRLISNYKPHVDELSRISSELTTDKTFDETLLLWHIATTICYDADESSEERYSVFSRAVSDYMLYLLLENPNMMSEVAAMGKIRYEATLDEAIKRYSYNLPCTDLFQRIRDDRELRDEGNSVLYAASQLTAELMEFEADQMWGIIGNVWAEIACYAAVHCSASAHVDQLPKGREFLTELWLLMEHLGLGKTALTSQA